MNQFREWSINQKPLHNTDILAQTIDILFQLIEKVFTLINSSATKVAKFHEEKR
jgi:hypothetical protein